MIKNENCGGFIDRQRKGVGVGEEENYLLFLLELCAGYCALADVFIKNKKKNKTTSVYRLCFARKFEQNHCPRMQQFHFRFMCIAQKGLLLSSLMQSIDNENKCKKYVGDNVQYYKVESGF